MTVVAMEVKSGPPTGHWDPDSLTVSATQPRDFIEVWFRLVDGIEKDAPDLG